MTPAPTAPADEVESFLEYCENTTDPEFEPKRMRLLRLCKKYREALRKISKDVCVEVSGRKTKFKTWTADEAIKALSYSGIEQEGGGK